jgi:hypothetical protein
VRAAEHCPIYILQAHGGGAIPGFLLSKSERFVAITALPAVEQPATGFRFPNEGFQVCHPRQVFVRTAGASIAASVWARRAATAPAPARCPPARCPPARCPSRRSRSQPSRASRASYSYPYPSLLLPLPLALALPLALPLLLPLALTPSPTPSPTPTPSPNPNPRSQVAATRC